MNLRFEAVWRRRVTVPVAFAVALVAAPVAPAADAGIAAGQDDGGVALRAAASRGEIDVVRALLAGGGTVDAANAYGATALMLACMQGHVDVVTALLEAGADADIADSFYGRTPLGWAAWNGHEEVVTLLFVNGAGGYEELFASAVEAGDAEQVAELLAMHVPEPDVLSAALQRAIETQNRALGELLMGFGAMPPPPEIVALDAEVLRRYEGVYADEVGFELEVRVDGDSGTLLARPSGMRNALRFLPIDEMTFIQEQSDQIFIRFVVRDNRVVSMTFAQPGETRRMNKR